MKRNKCATFHNPSHNGLSCLNFDYDIFTLIFDLDNQQILVNIADLYEL